jgi:hypothetical protein
MSEDGSKIIELAQQERSENLDELADEDLDLPETFMQEIEPLGPPIEEKIVDPGFVETVPPTHELEMATVSEPAPVQSVIAEEIPSTREIDMNDSLVVVPSVLKNEESAQKETDKVSTPLKTAPVTIETSPQSCPESIKFEQKQEPHLLDKAGPEVERQHSLEQNIEPSQHEINEKKPGSDKTSENVPSDNTLKNSVYPEEYQIVSREE